MISNIRKIWGTELPITLLALSLAFVAGCDDSSVTVAFPDDAKGRAAHCSAILQIEQLIFTRAAEEALPVDWLSDATIEYHRDKYDPALKATTTAAAQTGAIDPLDAVGIQTLIQDTLDSFNEDENEFKRHGDMCIDVFGPKE